MFARHARPTTAFDIVVVVAAVAVALNAIEGRPVHDYATDIRSWVTAANALAASAHAVQWRGPDAYDGLWWNWPRPLVAGRRRRQVMMQIHARSPYDVRRLYRRQHPLIPKALAIFASTDMRLHSVTTEQGYRVRALETLTELDADTTAGSRAWGYHWDMQTRWSFYPAGSPNVVVTSFGASALQEAAKAFGVGGFAERAMAAAQWTLDDVYLEDRGYFAYHPGSTSLIHNANLLGARTVWRLLQHHPTATTAVGRAIERSLASQRLDGSWSYGDGRGLGFVDSFHTGYVLESLAELAAVDSSISDALRRGASYYIEHFFADPIGRARLWPDRQYPEDAHAAGTGLTTLTALWRQGLAPLDLIVRVARRAVENVVDGHAIYRRYRYVQTRTTYLRWADAHLALGLSNAALALSSLSAGSVGVSGRLHREVGGKA